MVTEQKKQRESSGVHQSRRLPKQKGRPACCREKSKLGNVPGCCCVLKDGCAGCELHKNLWLSGKARMEIQLAAQPGQAHWLRTATMQSGRPFLNGTNAQ